MLVATVLATSVSEKRSLACLRSMQEVAAATLLQEVAAATLLSEASTVAAEWMDVVAMAAATVAAMAAGPR